ncbi:Hypothetical predicted protein [Mytilus galloprovincialis]|uniref:Uncharacterized protein n=1 Tax=Mytilus galloprovincialis TaxID=29158 RepID=A0A8B6D6I0_MYTGA|nr:Hypothetical predicted protein [Mytilus galloprovincialis]
MEGVTLVTITVRVIHGAVLMAIPALDTQGALKVIILRGRQMLENLGQVKSMNTHSGRQNRIATLENRQQNGSDRFGTRHLIPIQPSLPASFEPGHPPPSYHI